MIYYVWAHIVYHLVRWFPRTNRVKIRFVLLFLSLAFLAAQFVVMFLPHSERYCGLHLLDMLLVSIVTTFFMIGYCVLFSVMDPVPWKVKVTFHVFGVFCFILSIVHMTLTFLASQCKVYTTELYIWSLILTVLSILSTAYLVVTTPFWLMNQRWTNAIYDKNERSGLCYEPVTRCSCIWHI